MSGTCAAALPRAVCAASAGVGVGPGLTADALELPMRGVGSLLALGGGAFMAAALIEGSAVSAEAAFSCLGLGSGFRVRVRV